jgi:multidrug efflux pump subunit AcrB
MKSFFKFFAERHLLASLITIMIILLGLSTLTHIKRDSYPSVSYGLILVITKFPGASPEDVELNVTNKIEDELKSVSGIEKIISFSMENVSAISIQLEMDVSDPDKVRSEIREAVARVSDLPDEVRESPQIRELNTALIPVLEVGLTGDVDYQELRERARIFEKKMMSLPGISHVDRYGYRAREIRVEVSPEAIDTYQIPMWEIITAIQKRNIRGTSGSFESYTSEKDIVTLAQFSDPREVGDVIVRSTFEGLEVKISDLAVVSDDFEEERVLSRVNGRPAVSLLAYKSESADVIRTSDALKELVTQERESLPENIEIIYANDYARYVKNRFNVVLTNGALGFLLLLLVLPLFLSIRLAFWVALGIPIALLGTIFMLPLFDVYLDSMTLMGILLVLGIIVDDAIIVGENIVTHRERGKSPLDAAVDGIREVFYPVVTTVLTTFLVFAPMFFLTGTMGSFVYTIPLAIGLALLISLMEVTVALPAHLVHSMGKPSKIRFQAISAWYRQAIKPILKLRYALIPVFVVLLVAAFLYAGTAMRFVLFPSEMAEQFWVFIEMPTGTTLERTARNTAQIEQYLEELPEGELASYTTSIGVKSVEGTWIDMEVESAAIISVNLIPYAQRERTAHEIIKELRSKTESLEEIDHADFVITEAGPPMGRDVVIRVVGADNAERTRLADSVAVFLSNLEGVSDVTRDDTPGKEQVEIKIDYSSLSRLGLTVADIAQNVRIAYDGQVVTSIRSGEEDVNFRVMLEESVRERMEYLMQLRIPNRQGRLIPLGEVARLVERPGPSDYRHHDGERTITVQASVDNAIITPLEASNAVEAAFDLDREWPGMRLGVGGEAWESAMSLAGLARAFIIAIIGIYFLLVLLFNSLTQPFLVMAAIPFGITGVIFAFGFHGLDFGFFSMLGIIGLSGIVVNDSLVLINHVNALRKAQPDKAIMDILAQGTADRMRAIIMTTVTTVAALLPLAYGWGGTDSWMSPMALALGWGLIFATPLTLVLVPCLYMMGQDMHGMLRRSNKVSE